WRYHPDGTVAQASPPKEVRTFGGRQMLLEESIVTDYALVRAAVADKAGNCFFHAAARNFNPPAAMAGRLTVVEAEEVVDVGEPASRRRPSPRHIRPARGEVDAGTCVPQGNREAHHPTACERPAGAVVSWNRD